MNTNITTGTLARGYRLGKLGFSLVGSYLGYQAQNLLLGNGARHARRDRLHKAVSRRVRDELGTLKGPVMKLGQMLSMQTDFVPHEVLQELAGLQMQAPPMHATLARAQFKSAMGKYPEEAFREFDPEPFAAASLGQVHRAVTFDGEKVAVKIQYPAIRSAIENDLKLLRSAMLPTRVTGHVSPALLDEIGRGLLEETDYLHEARNIDYFRAGFAGLAFATVPRVYPEWSTDRVLTMSFVEGESLSDWLRRKPSHAARDLIGARLTEAFETQLQRLRVLHADQHPGNFLFQPDGRFGLVDFGCVKRVNFDIVELRRFYETRGWLESEAAERRFLSILFPKDAPIVRARKILPLLEECMDFLWPRGAGSDFVIDFRTARKNLEFNRMRLKLTRQIMQDKLINPDFVYLFRAETGFWHLIGELGATVNISEISRRVSAGLRRGHHTDNAGNG